MDRSIFFYSIFLTEKQIIPFESSKAFHLIIEDELLPAVGPHNLLHVATDHGEGKALKGGGVVLRTKAIDCIMNQGH